MDMDRKIKLPKVPKFLTPDEMTRLEIHMTELQAWKPGRVLIDNEVINSTPTPQSLIKLRKALFDTELRMQCIMTLAKRFPQI